jgi:soluble lytic murein transglycosylase-like protein
LSSIELSWRGVGLPVLISLLVYPGPSSAELVVMVDGQVLKVESFERRGEEILLGLQEGGRLTLSMRRVARILEDEIVEQPAADRRYAVGDLKLWFEDSQAIPETPFGELIYETSRRHEVNPILVAAMVRAESGFDPRAVSPKGAMGLLQLMPATATRFGLDHSLAFEPQANLEAGVRYFRWLGERFEGDLVLALAGYNAGEAMVARHDGVPPFRETDNYIQRVLEFAAAPPEGR